MLSIIANCFHYDILQPRNGVYLGTGANDYTFLIGNQHRNSHPNPGDELQISIAGTVQTNKKPADLSITMICYVGVGSCSETSTAVIPSNGITDPFVNTAGSGMTSEMTTSVTNSNDGIYSSVTPGVSGIPLKMTTSETHSNDGTYPRATTSSPRLPSGTSRVSCQKGPICHA